jgi:hypothetical protein
VVTVAAVGRALVVTVFVNTFIRYWYVYVTLGAPAPWGK